MLLFTSTGTQGAPPRMSLLDKLVERYQVSFFLDIVAKCLGEWLNSLVQALYKLSGLIIATESAAVSFELVIDALGKLGLIFAGLLLQLLNVGLKGSYVLGGDQFP